MRRNILHVGAQNLKYEIREIVGAAHEIAALGQEIRGKACILGCYHVIAEDKNLSPASIGDPVLFQNPADR